MVQNHVKRIRAPRTWNIRRKVGTFVTKGSAGPQDARSSVPLTVLFKDILGRANSTKELKIILHTTEVLVNGRRVKDYRFPVGLMDVLTLKKTGESFMVLFSPKGKIIAQETGPDEAIDMVRIKDKTFLKGGRVQLNFHDGRNLIVEKDSYKTGDTLVIDGKSVKDHLSLEKGCPVFLIGGRHIGLSGTVDEVREDRIIYKDDAGQAVETAREYAFVIGKDKPVISIR